MNREPPIRIGTSGWSYRHWAGRFYPAGLSPRRWLAYYAGRFDSVEVNGTFYRPLSRRTFESWRAGTPERFLFSVKASRTITHFKKLKGSQAALAGFLENARALGEKLGPILFQLPPRWKLDLDRLGAFLSELPAGLRYAFEFRDPSWFDERVYERLARFGAAFCIYHLRDLVAPRVVTAGFVYLRLHGPAGAYAGLYDRAALADWARAIAGWVRQGKQVYGYFDNDEKAYAARNAAELRRLAKAGLEAPPGG